MSKKEQQNKLTHEGDRGWVKGVYFYELERMSLLAGSSQSTVFSQTGDCHCLLPTQNH